MSRHLIKLIKKIPPWWKYNPPIINFGSTNKFPTSLWLSENYDQYYFDLDDNGHDLSHDEKDGLHHLHHRNHDHRHGELEGDEDDFEGDGDGDGDGDDCKDEYNVMTMIHVADHDFRVCMKDMAFSIVWRVMVTMMMMMLFVMLTMVRWVMVTMKMMLLAMLTMVWWWMW